MKINLKKLHKHKLHLKQALAVIPQESIKDVNNIIDLLDEIEVDLELCGESIVELDKDRLAAIEEKNKMIKFIKYGDDT